MILYRNICGHLWEAFSELVWRWADCWNTRVLPSTPGAAAARVGWWFQFGYGVFGRLRTYSARVLSATLLEHVLPVGLAHKNDF